MGSQMARQMIVVRMALTPTLSYAGPISAASEIQALPGNETGVMKQRTTTCESAVSTYITTTGVCMKCNLLA